MNLRRWISSSHWATTFAFASVLALVSLAALPTTQALSKPKSRTVEKSWVHPEFARFGIRRIAILPAVTFDGDYQASNATAAVWMGEFSKIPYEWVSADRVRMRLGTTTKQRDSLLAAIEAQVQKTGKVEPKTATYLGRLLGAQGLLCVRVDRWQIMNSASSRQTATVELSATLVDTLATELWKVAGSAINEGPVVSSRTYFENAPREAPAQAAGPTGAASSGGGSSGGSSGGGSSGASTGGSGGSGSGGGSGSSGGTTSGTGSTSGSAWTGAPPRNDPTSTDALKDLYVADLPSVYRGALTTIYKDWIPLLPAPGAPAGGGSGVAPDTTKQAR